MHFLRCLCETSAVSVVSELKSILENNYTLDPQNIETLYNKSREEIMQALVLKSNALSENDNLLIFYAGHGIAEKDKFAALVAFEAENPVPGTRRRDNFAAKRG